MTEKPKEPFEEWFQKAGEDELSCGTLIHEGGASSTACFLAQQMAEKYLKGFLVWHKIRFPKVHDLLELATLLIKTTPDIETIRDKLILLNRYYIETRYPGGYPVFSGEDARQAFEAALSIRQFVMEKIR